jgi:hypothetical protein
MSLCMPFNAQADSCPVHLQTVPSLYKHMMAVSYQMDIVLEASAMALALNRTIVFPKFYCWCDFDWYAIVLDGCAMGGRPGKNGADLFHMPFECPIDIILNAHHLYHRKVAYRQERWLSHPRVPLAMQNSREAVLVVDRRDSDHIRYRQRLVCMPLIWGTACPALLLYSGVQLSVTQHAVVRPIARDSQVTEALIFQACLVTSHL